MKAKPLVRLSSILPFRVVKMTICAVQGLADHHHRLLVLRLHRHLRLQRFAHRHARIGSARSWSRRRPAIRFAQVGHPLVDFRDRRGRRRFLRRSWFGIDLPLLLRFDHIGRYRAYPAGLVGLQCGARAPGEVDRVRKCPTGLGCVRSPFCRHVS